MSGGLRLRECYRSGTIDEALLGLGAKELVVELDTRAVGDDGDEIAFLRISSAHGSLTFDFIDTRTRELRSVHVRPTGPECRKLIRAARQGGFVVDAGGTPTTYGLTGTEAEGLEAALWECLFATQREG